MSLIKKELVWTLHALTRDNQAQNKDLLVYTQNYLKSCLHQNSIFLRQGIIKLEMI